MVNHLLMPQEIEVHYIIPTVRKHFALAMKQQGLSQKEIAARLGIRESTVSQYVSSKRAARVQFPAQIVQAITLAAQNIASRTDSVRETQQVLDTIRKSNVLCQIHRKIAGLPATCTLETTRCV